MLALPDVTLCCVYTVCHELHLMAVDECLKQARFGDVKLFTDQARGRDVISINTQDINEFAAFMRRQLPQYIKTSHVLYIQWDSWIINPNAWRAEFLEYDYIGAPWWYGDNYNVGNSGFCLRSKALIDFLSAHEREFPLVEPEDHFLCREYRKRLPQFKWASNELAGHFAFERAVFHPLNEIFGYHGIFNWPYLLSFDKIHERMAKAPNYIFQSVGCRQMLELMLKKQQELEAQHG